jgi:hypothetical protein
VRRRISVDTSFPKHTEREDFAEASATIVRGEVRATRMARDTPAPSLPELAMSRLALLTKQQARALQFVSVAASPPTMRT